MDEYDEKPYIPLWTSAEQRALILNNACLGIIGYYLVRIPLILISYVLAQLEGLRPELHYYGLVIDQISEDSVIQGAGWSGGSTIGAYFIGPLLFAFAAFYLLQRWEFLWMNGISLGLIIWTSLHGFSRLLCGAVAGVFIPQYVGQVFVATGLNLGVRVVLGIFAFVGFLALARFFLPPLLFNGREQRVAEDEESRAEFVRYSLFLPWLISSAFIALIHGIRGHFYEVIVQFLLGLVVLHIYHQFRPQKPEYNVPIPEQGRPKVDFKLWFATAGVFILIFILFF
ncbi:MAG: hypothetical protein ACO39U_04280 [Bacteroidia bacterium]|jgi:hypothetical protein